MEDKLSTLLVDNKKSTLAADLNRNHDIFCILSCTVCYSGKAPFSVPYCSNISPLVLYDGLISNWKING